MLMLTSPQLILHLILFPHVRYTRYDSSILPIDHSMDFEPEDSITYRTFERAFDTHPEECSSGTVCTVEECSSSSVCVAVVEKDTYSQYHSDAEPDHDATLKIDALQVQENTNGSKEETVEVEEEEEEEEEERKSDEEREEERNKEVRRIVVAESMLLYTAQLKTQQQKEIVEEFSDVKIEAKTEDKVDEEEIKVEKEVDSNFSPTFSLSYGTPYNTTRHTHAHCSCSYPSSHYSLFTILPIYVSYLSFSSILLLCISHLFLSSIPSSLYPLLSLILSFPIYCGSISSFRYVLPSLLSLFCIGQKLWISPSHNKSEFACSTSTKSVTLLQVR